MSDVEKNIDQAIAPEVEADVGTAADVDEIMKKYDGVKEFVHSGGITVTGGEPLLQIDFVTELFKTAKEHKIHIIINPPIKLLT